jgi:hypothetical protein
MQNDKYLYLFIGLCLLSAIVQIIAVMVMYKKEKNKQKLHELYCVLYKEIHDKYVIGSLCREIKSLKKITPEETIFLLNHFKSQKPNFFKNRIFYFNESYKGKAYWWNTSDISTEQRKMFIKMLVDKTSPTKSNLIDVFFEKNKKIF